MAKFVVFEGIDGAGSSTQAKLLQEYLIQQRQPAILSPEPTDGIIGKLIREILQKDILVYNDSHKFDEQMAYLFAADRYHHLYNNQDGVLKLIRQGINVISTRYYFSSLAYNGHTTAELEFIYQLNAKFPQPDLVIYLDIPVEVSLKRLQERKILEVYEEKEKLIRVKQNFEKIFANYQGQLLQVDATKPLDIIHQEIIDNFSQV